MFAKKTNLKSLKQIAGRFGILGNGGFFITNPKTLDQLSLSIRDIDKIPFLYVSWTFFSSKDYNSFLRDAWTLSEFPHQYEKSVLLFLFKISNWKQLMEKEEYEQFKELPDTITIYRGTQDSKSPKKGLSWTIDKKVALFFKDRWKDAGVKGNKLYQAEIEKKYCFAYFKDREEEEIVLNPKHLKNFKVIEG